MPTTTRHWSYLQSVSIFKINSHLRALSTMSRISQMSDGLLIHIISRKIDYNTYERWDEAVPSDKLPSWDDMSVFLERRCRTLENPNSVTVPAPSLHSLSRSSHRLNRRNFIASKRQKFCTFCDSGEHKIVRCSLFIICLPASMRYINAFIFLSRHHLA